MGGSIHSSASTRGRGTRAVRARNSSSLSRRPATASTPRSATPAARATRRMSCRTSSRWRGDSETMSAAAPSSLRAAACTSPKETAQTAQASWVRIRSGCNSRSFSSSIRYTESPFATTSRTWRSISADRAFASTLAAVRTGNPRTDSGKSHSCEMPTSRSRSPSRQAISVVLGRSEAIRCAMSALHHFATFFTVSQVRVVTSLPNVFSMSVMNTGP